MGNATLVEKDIEAGRQLIGALDISKFPVQAALWLYLSSADQWRLMIASPVVDEKGSKFAYDIIRDAIKERRLNLSLDNVVAASVNDSTIQMLRHAIKVPGLSGIRFTRNVINNYLIEDAYIYRMT